ncbi:YIF1-domain-containing protein [Suillus spraguei]|nr:YIF1-domain-containing protein [Suillus spraguei]
MSNYYSRSPPPLQHPVPTHPAFIPEPPSTPLHPKATNVSLAHHHQTNNMPHELNTILLHFNQFQILNTKHIPDFAAWGMNDSTAQFGMHLGQTAVAAGQDYVQKNFAGMIPVTILKHHFNAGHTEWQPPRDDINSPDLYIPLMALAFKERFHPQILGASATRALLVVLRLSLRQCGCYLLNVQGTGQVVDLIAYGGYKFVGVILTIFAGLLNLGPTVYVLVFVYAFAANALFHSMSECPLRSLRSVVLPDSPANVGTVNPASRKRRIAFLFLEAVLQVIYMGILVRV